jgi:hypothetical protein
MMRPRDESGLDDASMPLLERLRSDGVLSEHEWSTLMGWVEEARTYLARPNRTVTTDNDNNLVLYLDADPRNADWLQIGRVRRLTKQRIPGWAALWLWQLGRKRGPEFWSNVGKAFQVERTR